ncbi:1-deoxy-D-xylulose-5-phosphate synthase [Treponema sp. HNW]|uniref:1-deoxy-D-xylulose-5-phosphate synthase n=1 Tax=Treponema sp. HNW TaxID=3116654 RepID=UPI003D148AE2
MLLDFLEESLILLENIDCPDDIKQLNIKELKKLSVEIRGRIIDTVGKTGGHLASNLGVVDLTIALHKVFDSPSDAFIWDVSHQCYAHKILTGRNNRFDTLRQKDGLAGFTKREESPHDWFDAGHASTSISSALGLLVGRRLKKEKGKVIAVIGDGALTGGMAMEALSHAGQLSEDLVIVLNDNQMSINGNTGALSRYLSRLTMTAPYQTFRYNFDRLVEKIPLIGKPFMNIVFRLKRAVKGLVFPSNFFSDWGFEYVGPLNGHHMEQMITVFKRIKKLRRPVVVHVVTQKGRGYAPAESDPVSYHGYSPKTSKKAVRPSFTEVFSHILTAAAEKDERITAITAAMTDGTGLTEFERRFPLRFFDTGIAEQHAVTFAGGLARAGLKPVTAIYSTFIQRAVDQLIHDIALQKGAGIFMLDRSGAVPGDGETHQGIFDISLLRPVPNLSLLAPASEKELELCFNWALTQNSPVVIRYPKSPCPAEHREFASPVIEGRGVLLKEPAASGKLSSASALSLSDPADKILLVCTGGIFPEVLEASRELYKCGKSADIYNLRFLKPLDKAYFLSVASSYERVLFIEDGIRIGGIGTYLESLLDRYTDGKKTGVSGFPDRFLAQGSRGEILKDAHLDGPSLAYKALKMWN